MNLELKEVKWEDIKVNEHYIAHNDGDKWLVIKVERKKIGCSDKHIVCSYYSYSKMYLAVEDGEKFYKIPKGWVL